MAKKKALSIEDYVTGILQGDRTILGQAITLVESNSPVHIGQTQTLLQEILPHAGNSVRVGITGMPGAGKSTLIETLGLYLTGQGHRVAVMAIDPTSAITRGSILGDKTRMEKLAVDPNAFIRPSPSGGVLGGVARKTRETMLVFEAAGYDVILIETIGVGQNEITVRSMVDFILLMLLAGAGDELQGIKRGIIEIADAVVINKADGDNKARAMATKEDYSSALQYMTPATAGWQTRAFTCSALTGAGIPELWRVVEKFAEVAKKSGAWRSRRQSQARDWLHSLVQEFLQSILESHPGVKALLPKLEKEVMAGTLPVMAAAQMLIEEFGGRG